MTTITRTKKLTGTTKLERAVARWANERARDYDNGVVGVLKDLAYGGCQSGMVSGLIYYADTTRFYRRHRGEIAKLLQNTMESTGLEGPAALFGDKWEKLDPLAFEQFNQNLLAWFAFEETARSLAERAGLSEVL